MRLVLDTNAVLSGLLWAGTPGQLIDAALDGRIVVVTSIPLIAELQGVLGREKFRARLAKRMVTVTELVEGFAALAEIAQPATLPPVILRDRDDDQVLAAAIGGKADLIVSGDRHLLDVRQYRGIAIVSPATALSNILASPPQQ